MVGLVNRQKQDSKKKFAIILLGILIVLGSLTIILVFNLKKEGPKTTTKIKAETKTYEKVVRIPTGMTSSITPTANPEIASPTGTFITALNEDQQVDYYEPSLTSQASGSDDDKEVVSLPQAGSIIPAALIFLASAGLILIAFAL
ncbi:hypothetical protein A3J15_03260 [Candidatus Roizmanbacteria bacterium RIFCSPLOWO2_02_FULL_38_10]|uniref:Uncharacterized protein n=1 Tax=Candidatus Roizmanbacteria bacterium RIFCSPLOWO2_02_FULL_38_10 TaxID=1802074 RepID=A0A1F7JM62_9BACT|nr:MAG: hypothetical protein A3J15_03260 [Candidatus Roizmanbacteria bacterium RIFCSPLOWO2_02_FULL_38_10]